MTLDADALTIDAVFALMAPSDMELLPRRPAWMARAACSATPKAVFFPPRGHSPTMAGAAKALCRECPVRSECLGYALEHNERLGVWGGLTAEERRRDYVRRRTGAVERRTPKERRVRAQARPLEERVALARAALGRADRR